MKVKEKKRLAAGEFRALFTPEERELLASLSTPRLIQDFLDRTEYSSEPVYRSPRSVIRDMKAHCVDGALFASAAMRFHGRPALVMELAAVRDDDHFLALFREGGYWGCIAKSNFVGLRFREPIHRSYREVALSYFESYYNMEGEKSLRGFGRAVDIARLDWTMWPIEDGLIEEHIVEAVARAPHFALLQGWQEEGLSAVDKRTFEAGMLGANEAGIYRLGS